MDYEAAERRDAARLHHHEQGEGSGEHAHRAAVLSPPVPTGDASRPTTPPGRPHEEAHNDFTGEGGVEGRGQKSGEGERGAGRLALLIETAVPHLHRQADGDGEKGKRRAGRGRRGVEGDENILFQPGPGRSRARRFATRRRSGLLEVPETTELVQSERASHLLRWTVRTRAAAPEFQPDESESLGKHRERHLQRVSRVQARKRRQRNDAMPWHLRANAARLPLRGRHAPSLAQQERFGGGQVREVRGQGEEGRRQDHRGVLEPDMR